MSDEIMKCELCGEPMPDSEQMFKFHGYSGPCPKPPIKKEPTLRDLLNQIAKSMTPQLEYPDRGIVLLTRHPETGATEYVSFGIAPEDMRAMCRELAHGIPIDRTN